MFSWVERVGLSVVEKLAVQANIDLSSSLVTFLDHFGDYVAQESHALQLQQRCIRKLYDELEQSHARVTREVTALRGAIFSSLTKTTTQSAGALTTAVVAASSGVNDLRLMVDRHPQTYLPVVRVSLNYVPDLVVYVPRRYAAILKSSGYQHYDNNNNSCKITTPAPTTTTENDSERKSAGEGITFGLHVRREPHDTTTATTTTPKCDHKKQLTESVSPTHGQAENCVTPQKQKKKQQLQNIGNGMWPSPPQRTYRRSPRLSGKLAKAAENLTLKCKAAAWRMSVTDLVKCWVDAVTAIPPAELQRLQTWNCDANNSVSTSNNSIRNVKFGCNGKINGRCEEAGANVTTEKDRGVKRPASEMSLSPQTPRQKGRWKAPRVSASSSSSSSITSPKGGAVESNGINYHQHDRNGNNDSNRNSNDNQNNTDNNNNKNNNINSNSNSNNNNNINDEKTATHSKQGTNVNGNIKPADSSTNQKNVADSPQQKKQSGAISSAGLNSFPTAAANIGIYGPTAAKPPTGRPKHQWGLKTKARKQ